MSSSKKSNKKIDKKNDNNDKRIYYAFILLLLANIIVFVFFGYFIFRLFNNQQEVFGKQEVAVSPVAKLNSDTIPNVSAVSFVVYDPITRSIVMSKNPSIRTSPASSIKVLTALVALEIFELDDYLVSVPASFDESKMGLYAGEEMSVENLLYGLLMASGNDAAKTLSTNFPNGTNAFVIAMNRKAKEIGLNESNFVDPSGYMDSNYSTALELARLGAYAMKNDKIREIVGTQSKIVYDRYNLTPHYLTNLNELLVDDKITGIKTGFTNEAGGVLLTSYNTKGREFIIVVTKSQDRFSDTRTIINMIDESLYYSDVNSAD